MLSNPKVSVTEAKEFANKTIRMDKLKVPLQKQVSASIHTATLGNTFAPYNPEPAVKNEGGGKKKKRKEEKVSREDTQANLGEKRSTR